GRVVEQRNGEVENFSRPHRHCVELHPKLDEALETVPHKMNLLRSERRFYDIAGNGDVRFAKASQYWRKARIERPRFAGFEMAWWRNRDFEIARVRAAHRDTGDRERFPRP